MLKWSESSRRRFLRGVGAGATVTGLAGCSGTSESMSQLDYIHVNVYNPVYVARRKGFFEDHGISVNNVGDSFGGPQSIQAVSSQQADAGAAAITALANAVANNMSVRGVADLQSSFEGTPIHRWLVRDDSEIQDPSDLEGKRIGVNTLGASFHYTTLIYLQQHNMTADDVEFKTVPHPNMEQALREGNVDVAGMAPPFTVRAIEERGISELFNTIDVFEEIQVVQVFLGEHILKDSPELAESFLAGYVDAVDYIRENPDEARVEMAKALNIDTSYVRHQQFQQCAKADIDSTDTWLSVMRQLNELEGNDIPASDIISNDGNSCL